MGKPLVKIVSTIRSQLTAHAPTDDSRLEPELIEDMVLDIRSMLIRDHYKGNQYLEDSFFQIYDGIEIQTSRFTIGAVQEKYPELYSEIPALQSEVGFKNIRYFGTVDGRLNFTRVSMTGFISSDGRLFTAEEPVYVVNGTRIHMKNLPNLGMRYGKLIAVFYDPRRVPNFDAEVDFPAPDSMIHKIELIAVKQLASTLGIPPDILNDAADVVNQPIKEQ